MKQDIDGEESRQRVIRLLAEDPEQPLSDKLELMLPYMLQNMTISTNGVFRTKQTQIQVNYLSKGQKDRWGQLAEIARPEPPALRGKSLFKAAGVVAGLGASLGDVAADADAAAD